MTARPWLLAALVALPGLAGGWVPPAEAQEWKIFLVGKTEPIIAASYAEEAPWVFYQYVGDPSDPRSPLPPFAIGCNRVDRVERAGSIVPRPACPVDMLPTTMPLVFIALTELEAKRLDDSIVKLREQTRAYAEAFVGSFMAARGQTAAGEPAQLEVPTVARNLEGIAFLASQINDTLFDIRLIEQRVGRLLDAAEALRQAAPPPPQRFFFGP